MNAEAVLLAATTGHIDSNLLFSFILGLLGVIVSVVIWAASTHAARIQAREARLSRESLIDVETLTQIRKVYETSIDQLEAELDRMRADARASNERHEEEMRRTRTEARQFEEKAIALQAELQKLRDKMERDQAEREIKRATLPPPEPPAAES